MGDRGSITVTGKAGFTTQQPTLFRHWGGSPEVMQELVDKLQKTLEEIGKDSDPYGRRDVECIMALLVKLAVEEDGYSAYLGMTPQDGDNSDNGHFILNADTWELEHQP